MGPFYCIEMSLSEFLMIHYLHSASLNVDMNK